MLKAAIFVSIKWDCCKLGGIRQGAWCKGLQTIDNILFRFSFELSRRCICVASLYRAGVPAPCLEAPGKGGKTEALGVQGTLYLPIPTYHPQ